MFKRKQMIIRGVVVMVLGAIVASCGSSGGNGGGGGNSPPTVVRQENQFGSVFASAFRAPADSEPRRVNDGDLVPWSLTSEPVDIK